MCIRDRVINKPNWVFEIAHSSSICGSNMPFIASTEKANCAHSVINIKFENMLRDAKMGGVIDIQGSRDKGRTSHVRA